MYLIFAIKYIIELTPLVTSLLLCVCVCVCARARARMPVTHTHAYCDSIDQHMI